MNNKDELIVVEERKSIHNPCPYGNDDCPKCNNKQFMSTLKEIQEKGEISFKEMIYGSHGNGELINKDEFFFKIEDMLVFLHQQTTLAYNAGKADMLDTVLKEIDSLNTVDIKDQSGDVVQEQLISKDKLKNKLLDNK